MSSIPISPSIRTSERILCDQQPVGEMELLTRLPSVENPIVSLSNHFAERDETYSEDGNNQDK